MPKLKITIDTSHLKDIDIVNASAGRIAGRRFVLYCKDKKISKKLTFDKIFRITRKLNKNEDNLTKLQSLQDFLVTLKKAEEDAIIEYNRQPGLGGIAYRVFTTISRLFSSGSHLNRIKKLEKNIQNKIVIAENIEVLCEAAKAGDISAVKQMIRCGASLDVLDKEGCTPLGWAVYNGHFEVVKMLVNAGANVNFPNTFGQVPLLVAVGRNKIDIFQFLLNHQADPSIPDKNDQNVFIVAAAMGCKEICEMLLSLGKFDLTYQDKNGNTPLNHAIRHRHKNIVEMLSKNLNPIDFFIEKEILKLQSLGHSTHFGGSSHVKTNTDVSYRKSSKLEGSDASYILQKMKRATNCFSNIHPDLMADNEASELTQLFENGIKATNEEILEQIENGLPVLLPKGYPRHTVTVLVWGSYFIICNRGGASRKVIEVFQYDTKINSEVLNKIRTVKDHGDIEAYKKLFFEELPATLAFKPQGSFEKALEAIGEEYLTKQIVGNCSWASSEAGVFVYLALRHLLTNDQGQIDLTALPSMITTEQKTAIKDQFFGWLTFAQTYHLERYLGSHTLRSKDNVDKVKFHEDRRRAIKIDYAVLLSAIKAIHSTAKKSKDGAKIIEALPNILAKAITVTANCENKSLEALNAANEIVSLIEMITQKELEDKFELI